MKRIGVHVLGAVLALATVAAGAAVTSTVVDLAVPNGTVRYLDIRPDAPDATLIAFAGGNGYMGLQDDGTFTTIQGRCSAVGRNRQAFAEHGYEVVLIDDVTSASTPNMEALIDHLRQRANVPVWLLGISSSTDLTAQLAASLPAGTPLGAAFLSPGPLEPALAARIVRPSLVLVNANDTLQSGAQVYAALTAAPAKRITILRGGTPSACGGIGYHVFYDIEAAFVDAITAFVDTYNGTLGSGNATFNLNQHGLTGSWYEPATSGQGVEVEIFPDLAAPGIGFTQVSWFTFDAAAGGGQRWYTLSGPVVAGQPSAALTIYRNTGGNFVAPPVTAAQPVGTAALAFDTCASGSLAYTFSDGSGRSGSIPLTRLTKNVTCDAGAARPTNADFALSGNWYDPSTSGQGITVEVNPASNALFFAWYTYAPSGAAAGAAGQRWYTGLGNFAAGARSVAVLLYETTGGVFNAITPVPNTVPVGTGTVDFQGCADLTLTYSFTSGPLTGKAGTQTLQRVGPVPVGCVL